MEPISVKTVDEQGGGCSVVVTQGGQTAKIPCKDKKEAGLVEETIKAEIAKIDASKVNEATLKNEQGKNLVAKA